MSNVSMRINQTLRRGATVRNFACACESYAQAPYGHGLWVVKDQLSLELSLVRLGRLSIEDDKRRIRPVPWLVASVRGMPWCSVLDLQGRRGVPAEDADAWARHDVRRDFFFFWKIKTRTKPPFHSSEQR